MPLFDDFDDARAIAPEAKSIIQLAKTINHHVGLTPTLITRPATGERLLTLRCDSGTIRYRPGRYEGKDWHGGEVNPGEEESLDMIAHGFTTGEGPYQFTKNSARMAALTSIVIDEVANTFTRTVGSWWLEGFRPSLGQVITVADSASNDGNYTSVAQTGTVLTVVEDITVGEEAQTDLVITGTSSLPNSLALLTDFWVIDRNVNEISLATNLANALAGVKINLNIDGYGLFNMGGPAGWGPTAVASLNAGSYGSVALVAGEQITVPAPDFLTVVGFSATDALTYWFSR